MKKIVILILFLGLSCKFAERELYILPKGFIGNVLIVFNTKNGSEKVYDQYGRRSYLIPTSGILLSRFTDTYGVINKKFIYSNKDKTLNELKGIYFRDSIQSLDTGRVYAFYGIDATITFPQSKDSVGIQFISVCKPRDLVHFMNQKFVKRILGMQFSPEDVNYKKLLDLKTNP